MALIGFTASIPIIPFFIRDLGVSDPASLNIWVGACAAAPAICMFLFAPPWVQLADSHGKRLLLPHAIIGGAVVMALTGAANQPWQILVLRGLQGALTGTVSAASVLVATISLRERLGHRVFFLHPSPERRSISIRRVGERESDPSEAVRAICVVANFHCSNDLERGRISITP